MCGIIGYSGPLEAGKLLLNGLAGLEYRGYDSAVRSEAINAPEGV